MAKEPKDHKYVQIKESHEGEEEALVDLEGELISSLEYIDVLRYKYDDLKKENKKPENNSQKEIDRLTYEIEESNRVRLGLKFNVEELKIIEDVMKSNLQYEMDKFMKLES